MIYISIHTVTVSPGSSVIQAFVNPLVTRQQIHIQFFPTQRIKAVVTQKNSPLRVPALPLTIRILSLTTEIWIEIHGIVVCVPMGIIQQHLRGAIVSVVKCFLFRMRNSIMEIRRTNGQLCWIY